MRRLVLGLLALVFLTSGIMGLAVYGTADSSASAAASVAVRAGALLGALWLALPQLEALFQRFPAWLIASVAGAALVVVVRPRMLIYVLPLLAALAILRFFGWILQPLPPQTGQKKRTENRPRGDERSI